MVVIGMQQKHFEAFQKYISRGALHNQWLPAEEYVRRMNKDEGFTYTPSLLNRALLNKFQYDKYSFDANTQRRHGTIHVQHRQKVIMTDGGKKRPKQFYFASMTEKHFDGEEDIKVFQQIWTRHENTRYWKSNHGGRKRQRLESTIDTGVPQATETSFAVPTPAEPLEKTVVPPPTNAKPFVEMVVPCQPNLSATPSVHPIPSTPSPVPTPAPPEFSNAMQPREIAPIPPERQPSISSITIPKAEYSKLKNAQALAFGLKEVLTGCKLNTKKKKRVRCKVASPEVQRMFAAISAEMPQVSSTNLSSAMATAIYGFGQQVMKKAKENGYSPTGPLFTMEQCADCAPSEHAFSNWTKQLAIDNLMTFRPLIDKNGYFFQTDAGPNGQEIMGLTVFDQDDKTEDSPYGSWKQMWLGTENAGGKTSDVVAEAFESRCGLLYGDDEVPPMFGHTTDSGAGTADSLYAALDERELVVPDFSFPESCGLHDMQSIIRLPIQDLIGKGALEENSAPQLLHTVYTLYKETKKINRWEALVRGHWAQLCNWFPSLQEDPPKELLEGMQKPIDTRWWTIGSAASKVSKYMFFYRSLGSYASQWLKSSTAARTAADNLHALCNHYNIANVHFLSGIFNEFVNKHMKWFQGFDPLLGKGARPGFLSLHRTTRYLLMLEELNYIKANWRSLPSFERFRRMVDCAQNQERADASVMVEETVSKKPSKKQSKAKPSKKPSKKPKKPKPPQKHYYDLTTEQARMALSMVDKFLDKMIDQTREHNGRYLSCHPLIRSCFAEKPIGLIVTKCLLGIPLELSDTYGFHSKVHKQHVDLGKLSILLHEEVAKHQYRNDKINLWVNFKDDLESYLKSDEDMWSEQTLLSVPTLRLRKKVLKYFAGLSSTQHSVERHVKCGALAARTGKSETTVNIWVIARQFEDERFVRKEQEQETSSEEEETVEHIEHINRRKRVHQTTKMRTTYNESSLREMSERLSAVKQDENFNELRKNIERKLTDSNNRMLAKSGRKFEQILQGGTPLFARNKKPSREAEIRPALLHYKRYFDFRQTVFIPAIVKELELRGRSWKEEDKPLLKSITKLLDELKLYENVRVAKFLREKIRNIGFDPGNRNDVGELVTFLKLKGYEDDGEMSVDFNKNFKPQNPDLQG